MPVLVLLWGAALLGFASKVLVKHRIDHTFSPLPYVALGWLPAMILTPFVPLACLAWMALGGVLYTVGVIFLVLDHRVRYFHAAWHLFVMGAAPATTSRFSRSSCCWAEPRRRAEIESSAILGGRRQTPSHPIPAPRRAPPQKPFLRRSTRLKPNPPPAFPLLPQVLHLRNLPITRDGTAKATVAYPGARISC
jgi:hypothetical protein